MAILIKDHHTERLIEAEQKHRGDGSATKTARSLIVERLTQLDYERRAIGAQGQSAESRSENRKNS